MEDIERICPVADLPSFPELKQTWKELLKVDAGIPQYFGLLAIQCLAATLMEAENKISHRDYNVRLSQLLGLSDKYCLQPLYVGDNPANPIQQQIWLSATEFLRLEFGLAVNIPSPTFNAGRFVQFPKSQALLTKEDLKRCSGFFFAHFLIGEAVHFSFFKQKLLSNLSEIPLVVRARDIIRDSDRSENAIRQLFNDFNSWDGNVYETTPKLLGEKQLAAKRVEGFEGLMLSFENDAPRFFLLAPLRNIHEKVTSWDQKSRTAFPGTFREISFFQESSTYDEEFHASRFFIPGETRYILVDKTSKTWEYRFLLHHSRHQWQLEKDVILFETAISESEIAIFQHYLERPTSAKLWGGIKTGKDNSYIASFGPEIITSENYLVICNGRPVENYTAEVSPGSYVVRSSGNRDLKFNVVTAPITGLIAPTYYGWDLRDFSPGSVSPDIEGCIPNVDHKASKTEQWHNLQQKPSPEFAKIIKLLFT